MSTRPESNPYTSPSSSVTESIRPAGVAQPAWTLIVLGVLGDLMAIYNLVFWGLVRLNANPLIPLDPDEDLTYANTSMANYQLAIAFAMLIQGTLMFSGGWHLLKGYSRRWAISGACAAVFPPTCACIVPAVAGIWTLFLLQRKDIQQWFMRNRE